MIPHASRIVEQLRTARGTAGHLLLGLDFDGTLTPIMPRPEDAALPRDAGDVLLSLSRRADTWIAILSGRALRDIAQKVGLDGAFYAGNHGLEITGPGVHRVHEQAEAARSLMAELSARLQHDLAAIPGAQLEDKGLTLSVHYRRAPDEHAERRSVATVEQLCAPFDELRVTHGKKVVEVRPAVDWHKGEALRFLRDTIARGAAPVPTVFIGDDITDEDGFRQVGPDGYGIIVADPVPADTAAQAYLRSPAEVVEFLRQLDGS
jgi:trehalose 6-phosphate phosphatase